MIRAWLDRKLDDCYRTGATLDERAARYVRRARRYVPFLIVVSVAAIVTEDDPWDDVFWFTLLVYAVFACCVLTLMLRGHAERARIDTRDVKRFDLRRISAGAALGVALGPLAKRLEESWPWW